MIDILSPSNSPGYISTCKLAVRPADKIDLLAGQRQWGLSRIGMKREGTANGRGRHDEWKEVTVDMFGRVFF
jgi:hypothetical protein